MIIVQALAEELPIVSADESFDAYFGKSSLVICCRLPNVLKIQEREFRGLRGAHSSPTTCARSRRAAFLRFGHCSSAVR